MNTRSYNRDTAVAYARQWAYKRNPAYYDFSDLGGDCTNYASQCVFAGSGVMNFTPVTGWFYRSANDRTASWTGVEYLFDFLIGNRGFGPYGVEVGLKEVLPGDLIQLGTATDDFYHTPVVTSVSKGRILVAAHSYDTLDRPLTDYQFFKTRCIHIAGVRF